MEESTVSLFVNRSVDKDKYKIWTNATTPHQCSHNKPAKTAGLPRCRLKRAWKRPEVEDLLYADYSCKNEQ